MNRDFLESLASGNKGKTVAKTPMVTAPASGELEINDFVQKARHQVTMKSTLVAVTEETQVSVMVRGNYYAPGVRVPEADRKLYLALEGPSEEHIKRAKRMFKEVIEEATEKHLKKEGRSAVA